MTKEATGARTRFRDRLRPVAPGSLSRESSRSCGDKSKRANRGSAIIRLKTFGEVGGHCAVYPLLAAAEDAGVEVRRGVSVQRVEGGTEPAVLVNGSGSERISARLVIAANGRGSAIRKQTGISVSEQGNVYFMAGVLLTNVHASTEIMHAVFNPDFGTWTGLIPQAGGQFRTYLTYPKTVGFRIQGEPMLDLFLRESAKVYPPMGDFCDGAKSIGPLASFDASDTWVEEPYRDGVALVGDAAATTDPTFGQGLSFALRAARVLRDELTKNSDWDVAGRHYAEQLR